MNIYLSYEKLWKSWGRREENPIFSFTKSNNLIDYIFFFFYQKLISKIKCWILSASFGLFKKK